MAYQLNDFFSSLTVPERDHFYNWLQNELQGKQKDMWDWFEVQWNGGSKEEAWQKIYPSQTEIVKTQIHRLNSRLTEKIELYLSILNLRKDPLEIKLAVNREMLLRNNGLHFPHTRMKTKNWLQKSKIRDKTYYQTCYKLDQLDRSYRVLYPGRKHRYYVVDQALWEIHGSLSWALEEMEKSVVRIFQIPKDKLEFKKEESLAYEILKKYSVPGILLGKRDHLIPRLFCLVFEALQSEKPITKEEGDNLIKTFKDAYQLLRFEKRHDLFSLIFLRFNQSAYNTSNLYYLNKRIELFELALGSKEKILAFNRYHYFNIIRLYLLRRPLLSTFEERKKLDEKVEAFIPKYAKKLPIEEQKEAALYVEAFYSFSTGAYSKIKKLFQSFTFKDLYYEIIYTTIWLQARYELGERTYLVSYITNLRANIKNNKSLPKNFKETHLNRLRLFKRLIECKNKRLEKLKMKISRTQPLTDIEWLLEKVQEKLDNRAI